jgi:hypothetical protein
MNFSARNICVVLLAVVLGTYLLMPKADAADLCAGAMCQHCTGRIFSVNESATKSGLVDHLCDVSLGNFPCNLDKNSNLNAPAVITSSTNSYRQVSGILFGFAGYHLSSSHNVGGNDKAAQFNIAPCTIPIYLQNLSLLC